MIQRLGAERSVLPFDGVLEAVRAGGMILVGGSGGRMAAIVDR